MTVTWTKAPSNSVTSTKQPKVNTTLFGDGYTQRSADGIHPLAEEWSLTFEYDNPTDRDTDEATLVTLGGYTYFLWTPPRQSVQKKYICSQWGTGYGDDGVFTLSAKFTQVWDL